MKPNRYYEHKQHAFDSYCKKVLKCEACNGYRQISRHQKRFASLEELSEADVAQLAVYDRYSWEYTAFSRGKCCCANRERPIGHSTSTAVTKRPGNFYDALVSMDDRRTDSKKCMGMARRTVNTRRYKAYRLLKKLMGGEADD